MGWGRLGYNIRGRGFIVHAIIGAGFFPLAVWSIILWQAGPDKNRAILLVL
jgi:hypothetical protein